MAESKPPTTLKLNLQTLGKREDVADLFDQLNALGVLDRSLDITLTVGVYFEWQARELRRAVHDLIKEHPAIVRTKSYVQLATKTTADERILETPDDIAAEPDEDEDDVPPLLRYEREQRTA